MSEAPAAAKPPRGRRFRAPMVWLAAAVLAAGLVAADRMDLFTPPRTDAHGHALNKGPRWLVSLPGEQWTAAEITVDGEKRRVTRDGNGVWRHDGSAAASAAIAQALEVFGRAQVMREITASRDVGAYGVLRPRVSVAVYTSGSSMPAGRYFFGDLAPDELNRYVLISGEFLVVLVPEYHVENLVSLTQVLASG